jgi:hypothetical protein
MVSASAPFVSSSGVANALNATYTGIWASPYTTKESIFSMPMTTTNGPGGQNGLPHYFSQGSSESYYLLATSPVYVAMAATDVRKTLMVAVGTAPTKYYLTKWPDLTTLTNYPPVIRYAEVLLSRAEAIVRSGGAVTQGAVDLLNAVRVRSYPTGAYTLAGLSTTAAFYTAVLQERNFEFLGEGIRAYDIMRLGQTIPAKDGGNMGTVAAIPSSSVGYMWPISAVELSLNKLMTANE